MPSYVYSPITDWQSKWSDRLSALGETIVSIYAAVRRYGGLPLNFINVFFVKFKLNVGIFRVGIRLIDDGYGR